ncbi:universal stress protein [Chamaesiphon minutus]|uniref:Universal stress protein UspA-like protein n=1 Tax=Chamaesiphon minutus (strain ATCC 27169 / PCC 6605) TaxID=1173020 RepID=K9UDM1_CHAP6|nr:universal stress protein [Chamaesiphon minutus]AFY92526.1 universal stress protein UspA-like protein [Chamaesiphon minutus PCC 6605]
MLQKILLAIGDSPDSEKIFAAGLTLAQKLGAEMLLLHVLAPLVPHGLGVIASPLVGGVLPMTNDLAIEQYLVAWQESERNEIQRLQAYADRAKEHHVKAEILQSYGNSGPLICEAAKNWSAEVILMGRNQKSMLSEIWLGSTSNYVLHHAPCSTLVIQLPALST